MGQGIEGNKVRLVPMEMSKHFENALKWINDLSITEWIGTMDSPISRMAETDWFEARSKAGRSEANWAIETLSGQHIGFSNLFRIEFEHRTGHSGSLIGDSEFRGKGYGADAARARAIYAFDCLGLATLYSCYFEENEGSARMQAAVGYQIWGRQPQAKWKRGSYRTMVHTYLTKDMLRLQAPVE